MCKLLEDMRNETAILAFIESGREFNVTEAEIKKKIMEKFNLTDEQAKEYMLRKSA